MTTLAMTPVDDTMFDGMAFLLDGAGLPTADLRAPGRSFFRFDADELVGYGGIEGDGPDRLLRSLLIVPDRRRLGAGGLALSMLEREAARTGTARLHLLTVTAASFLRRHGYAKSDRATAPSEIARSTEFTSLCPASATYLVKALEPTDAGVAA